MIERRSPDFAEGAGELDRLIAMHTHAWGEAPQTVVTSPGRVNLIGDHVDYAHLPVLPIAIQRRALIAAGRGSDGRFRGLSSAVRGLVYLRGDEDPKQLSGWQAYAAAVVGQVGIPSEGAVITVGGDLPTSGGLSSSSALVVGLTAALSELQGHGCSPGDLVEMSVAAERSVGVAGGTMDQTVIVHAVAGHALRIAFAPPSYTPVPIDPNTAFVVAASGRIAAKVSTARAAYNRLSLTARIVAQLAQDEWGGDAGDPPRLGDLRPESVDFEAWAAGLPAEMDAAAIADRVSGFTEMAPFSNMGRGPLPVGLMARHMSSEAYRVDRTVEALRVGDRARIGALMDASHESLRTIGTVTNGLDVAVDGLRGAGANGARVTGAGFGGYAVGVCSPDQVSRVLTHVRDLTRQPAFAVVASQGVRIG